LLFLTVIIISGLIAGCAVVKKDNRRCLNGMDELISPDSTAVQIALAPVMVPTGTAALVVDMAIVHPACMIPEAAEDVYDLYWKPRDMNWLRKSLLFPILAAATPPTFIADWLYRSLFPTKTHDNEED